ncbi:MAG: TlpA family protein disulfide reductase [Myxococcales bacterium]|nr:TlpA family protein disulfide reductase [Myxococcales bacterium]
MKRYLLAIAATLAALSSACVPAKGGSGSVSHLSLDDVDGKRHYLSDYIGRKKAVVMTFWATWCVPCKDELPVLQKIYERERDRGLEIIAIAMDGPETQAQVGAQAQQMGLTFPVLLDTDSRAVALYNPKRAAPMLRIFDEDGRIVYSHTTFRPSMARKLERKITSVLRGGRDGDDSRRPRRRRRRVAQDDD